MKSIGQKIKEFRKENKLTQVELAKKATISRSYLADIEKDRYNASLDTLKSIANALDINISDLLDQPSESKTTESSDKKVSKNQKEINTIAAHLEDKDLTPKKVELIKSYIDALFDDDDW
ncbi:MAG: helix-turn-helix domain-containing protein [Clostridium chrysemydis]|uniref:helix-turn-helix domain-containing protein n=1 Tax=Clostridium chrysemydis TaxID=2665504 RepID=UPI003F38BBC0